MARTHHEILRVVLGPYVQYYPCEASEQKLGQKPKSAIKVIELKVGVNQIYDVYFVIARCPSLIRTARVVHHSFLLGLPIRTATPRTFEFYNFH